MFLCLFAIKSTNYVINLSRRKEANGAMTLYGHLPFLSKFFFFFNLFVQLSWMTYKRFFFVCVFIPLESVNWKSFTNEILATNVDSSLFLCILNQLLLNVQSISNSSCTDGNHFHTSNTNDQLSKHLPHKFQGKKQIIWSFS